MRYRLRTLLILIAVGPPVIALAWWYGRAVIGVVVLAMIFCPEILFGVFAYTFGGLCHLIGRLPPPGPRKTPPPHAP
ncbi:MAG: hypothetical protein SFU86_21820 [Pirellulaceae bacterium]|nr:hypothetical protein [Pirellulaceae bacterium]